MQKLLFVFLSLLWATVAHAQFADQRQYVGISTGSANAQAIAIPNYALNIGTVIRFRASFTNTGALTLNINGQGAIATQKQTLSGLQNLVGGEVIVGQITEVIFDGAQYEIVSPGTFSITGGQVIAGGSTVDLGAVASHYAIISGSSTISSFGSSANVNNPIYYVTFGYANILVNSANMVLPGNSNIQTNIPLVGSAGDLAIAIYQGAGVWQVASYSPINNDTGIAAEIKTFAGSVCPNNWVPTDGSAVSRTADAGLFAAIGTTYGVGDGTTTFNVPDGRGYFARVWDNGAGRDSGRAIGSTQTNQVGQASGPITATFSSGITTPSVVYEVGTGTGTLSVPAGAGSQSVGQVVVTGTVTGTTLTNSGNADNRPINIAYQNCIKL